MTEEEFKIRMKEINDNSLFTPKVLTGDMAQLSIDDDNRNPLNEADYWDGDESNNFQQ